MLLHWVPDMGLDELLPSSRGVEVVVSRRTTVYGTEQIAGRARADIVVVFAACAAGKIADDARTR